MSTDLTILRYAQLFELLRQQNQSENTSARLRTRSFARVQLDSQEAAQVKLLAIKSWN